MTTIIQTIEADLQAAGKWLEAEFEVAAKQVWSVVSNVFNAQEPVIVANILTAITTFLGTVEADVKNGTTLEDLETKFLNWIVPETSSLLTDAKNLGSVLLQALIALAIKDLPAIA